MTDRERFERLIRARHPCVLIETFEEAYALDMVKEAVAARRFELFLWSADEGLRSGWPNGIQPVADTTHAAAALYYLRQKPWKSVAVFLDLINHLGDEGTLRQLRGLIDHAASLGSTVVLIDHRTQVPPVIAAYAARLELSLPDEAEIEALLLRTLRREHEAGALQVNIKKSQMQAVIKNLRGLTRRQIERIILETVADDRRFGAEAIDEVVVAKRRALGDDGLLEFIRVPTSLDQVGGLKRLKAWLKLRQHSMSEGAAVAGLPHPRGVLLLGVQGAGKSLCAKAIATAWHRPLLRLDPGGLYDRYIGESERRLRACLHQAERMAPIVLWVDEIEKGFASAASTSTDGGLSRRIFGTLLTWMQEHTAPLFLVATANDIEALPPELLRKGRFDEIFFVDLPGPEARRQILGIHLRGRGQDPAKFDLDALAAATDGFSGAEIEAAILAALHDCFGQGCPLTTAGVLAAAEASPPLSVTMAEKVEMLREWAQGRTVPAE